MSGETDNADFMGLVLNAAVAAMSGCPWIEKGRILQVAEGIAEVVVDRVEQVDSFHLPNGAVWGVNRPAGATPGGEQ